MLCKDFVNAVPYHWSLIVAGFLGNQTEVGYRGACLLAVSLPVCAQMEIALCWELIQN